MSTRPSVYPEWATTLSNNGPLGGPSRVEPSSGDKATGFLFPQQPPREWFNWLLYTNFKWIEYLDEEITAGGNTSFAQSTATTTGLTFGYKAGTFVDHYAGTLTEGVAGTIALTANDTNYIVYRPGTGVAKIVGVWSPTEGDVPLWKIVTDGSGITSIKDIRTTVDRNVTRFSNTNRILGRSSAGAGNAQEVTVGNGLRLASSNIFSTIPPVRQTVLSALVDANGYPFYISSGSGLSVDIAATSVPVVLTAAGGNGVTGIGDRIAAITSNTVISGLTASATNYLYADIDSSGVATLGHTILAPVYQFGGTYSVTNGQFTFNIQEMTGKVGNGVTADLSYRVYIGEAVTNGSGVTSVVNYALLGKYRAVDAGMVNAAANSYSFSHNIGIREVKAQFLCINTTTEGGYAVGDIAEVGINMNPGDTAPLSINRASRNTATVRSGSQGTTGFIFVSNTTGAGVLPTNTSWNVSLLAERGW